MNKKQKIIASIAAATFAITLLAAPWTVNPAPRTDINYLSGQTSIIPRSSYSETSPIWDAPYAGQLNIGVLLAEWAGIGIVGGILFALFKDKPIQGAKKFTNN